jgi:hypothetical protein
MSESISNLTGFATYGLNQLLRWATTQQISFGFERSIRLHAGCFESRRALYSFAKQDLGPQALEFVLQQTQAMNAPETLQLSLSRFFSAAAFVHFGFECSGDVLIGKCYLELPAPSVDAPLASGRLQFLGFKWSMNSNAVAVVTRYRTHAAFTWPDVEQQILKNTGSKCRTILGSLLADLRRIDLPEQQVFHLLEIEEEGSDRHSYDLNVYDLQRSVCDLDQHLPQIATAFELPDAELQAWQRRFASAPIGHIATGQGRNGQPFVTLYHGDNT